MSLLLLVILKFHPYFSLNALKCILFFIGILCCYQVIVFAIGTQCVPRSLLNVTVAFLNCINMLGGFFFHSLIGNAMNYFQPTPLSGEIQYLPETYAFALMIIPAASLVGSLLIGKLFLGKASDLASIKGTA